MKAWELIEQKGWCKNSYARNEEGNPCPVLESEACSFCATGAITRCYGWYLGEGYSQTLKLFRALGEEVPDWNDAPGRTKEEVVAKLKELDI